ncbi:MAG: TVP38/TMEM64 family protein [Gammaproteobacteria bacterium]|nr:TVP38/TMEM64 family protein [Gammaproteobacteria bacterium]HSG10892.1 TVP38/TMEM64 family protein [Gammaproteobacteria bacterium]
MKAETLRRGVILLVLLAGIAAAVVLREHFSVELLTESVGQLGWLAPLVFIAGYAIATVFFFPGLLFTLAGGVLFGPFYGTLYNLTGATLGATLAFLLARYLAYDWVAQRTGKRLRQLVEGVENEGWRFVAFVRLVPLFPFNLLNYALGLTKIPLAHYVITSLLFMAPGGAAYTYLGYAGRELAGGGEDVIRKGLLALAVVASIAFISRILMKLRQRQTGGQA